MLPDEVIEILESKGFEVDFDADAGNQGGAVYVSLTNRVPSVSEVMDALSVDKSEFGRVYRWALEFVVIEL